MTSHSENFEEISRETISLLQQQLQECKKTIKNIIDFFNNFSDKPVKDSLQHKIYYFGRKTFIQHIMFMDELLDSYVDTINRRPLEKIKQRELDTMKAAAKLKTIKSFNGNNIIAIGEEIESPYNWKNYSGNVAFATMVGTQISPPVHSTHMDLSEYDDYNGEQVEIEFNMLRKISERLRKDIDTIDEMIDELPKLLLEARVYSKKFEVWISFYNNTKNSSFYRLIDNSIKLVSKFLKTLSSKEYDNDEVNDIKSFAIQLIQLHKDYLMALAKSRSKARSSKLRTKRIWRG